MGKIPGKLTVVSFYVASVEQSRIHSGVMAWDELVQKARNMVSISIVYHVSDTAKKRVSSPVAGILSYTAGGDRKVMSSYHSSCTFYPNSSRRSQGSSRKKKSYGSDQSKSSCGASSGKPI